MHCADNPLVVQVERLSQTVLMHQSFSSRAMCVMPQPLVPQNSPDLFARYTCRPREETVGGSISKDGRIVDIEGKSSTYGDLG